MSDSTSNVGNAAIGSSAALGVGTSTGNFLGWVNEYAALIGIVLTVISLIIGVYFKIRAERIAAIEREEDKRRQAEQDAAMLDLLRNLNK